MTARRWRFYATAAGRSPVREFLDTLSDAQAAQMLAAMRVVAVSGLVEARHLRGDVYEVRASIGGQAFRVLFAKEGAAHMHSVESADKFTVEPRLHAVGEAEPVQFAVGADDALGDPGFTMGG